MTKRKKIKKPLSPGEAELLGNKAGKAVAQLRAKLRRDGFELENISLSWGSSPRLKMKIEFDNDWL